MKRSIEEVNAIRVPLGFKPKEKAVRKSNAILTESKKAKSQAVLAKMLGTKGQAVVKKILDKALDDNDEDQMACLRLVADRIIPLTYFDPNKAKTASNGVTIQIVGVGQTNISSDNDVIEGEVIE